MPKVNVADVQQLAGVVTIRKSFLTYMQTRPKADSQLGVQQGSVLSEGTINYTRRATERVFSFAPSHAACERLKRFCHQ
jgi:hypothetical protein